jgi:hypothetical protein
MTTTSVANLRPKLQALFGPLSARQDAAIREILAQVDTVLLQIAAHFGLSRAGWEGTGLDLCWAPMGQVWIFSFVGPCDGNGRCVDFIVELKPSWCYDEMPGQLAWDGYGSVTADCQHNVDHDSMHEVHEIPDSRFFDPLAATEALLSVSGDLLQLARSKPLEHWLQLASL